MALLAAILTLLSLGVKLWHDLRVHYKNLKNSTAIGINHGKEAWYMALGNAPSLVLFTLDSEIAFYFAAPLSFFMILFSVWTIFDGGYGLGKGKGFFYTGDKNYKGTAKTDLFLRKLKLWQHVTLKLGGMGGTIYLYLKFLN